MTSSCQEKRVCEVWCLTSALRVDAHQAKLIPDFIKKDIDAKFHVDRDASVLRVVSNCVNIFDRDGIDLVVDVDALHILAIAFNRVDQVTDIVVSIELHVGVVDLVLLHDGLDHALIDLGQLHGCTEMDTTGFLRLDNDLGFFFVETDACVLHFAR